MEEGTVTEENSPSRADRPTRADRLRRADEAGTQEAEDAGPPPAPPAYEEPPPASGEPGEEGPEGGAAGAAMTEEAAGAAGTGDATAVVAQSEDVSSLVAVPPPGQEEVCTPVARTAGPRGMPLREALPLGAVRARAVLSAVPTADASADLDLEPRWDRRLLSPLHQQSPGPEPCSPTIADTPSRRYPRALAEQLPEVLAHTARPSLGRPRGLLGEPPLFAPAPDLSLHRRSPFAEPGPPQQRDDTPQVSSPAPGEVPPSPLSPVSPTPPPTVILEPIAIEPLVSPTSGLVAIEVPVPQEAPVVTPTPKDKPLVFVPAPDLVLQEEEEEEEEAPSEPPEEIAPPVSPVMDQSPKADPGSAPASPDAPGKQRRLRTALRAAEARLARMAGMLRPCGTLPNHQ